VRLLKKFIKLSKKEIFINLTLSKKFERNILLKIIIHKII